MAGLGVMTLFKSQDKSYGRDFKSQSRYRKKPIRGFPQYFPSLAWAFPRERLPAESPSSNAIHH